MSKVKPTFHQPTFGSIILYQYMSWENAEKVFTNWELKATLPHHTNDPFELMISDDEPSESQANVLCSSRHEKQCNLCFLCFSKVNASAALWGHYGDSHQGICLQFTFPLTFIDWRENEIHHGYINANKTFPGVLYKVTYRHERFCSKNVHTDDYTTLLDNGTKLAVPFHGLASIKDESWAFEQEYRIITDIGSASRLHNGMVFYNAPMDYLTGIDLGIRCKHNIHYVQWWLQHTLKKNKPKILLNGTPEKDKVTIRQMVPSRTTFEVEPAEGETSIFIRHSHDYMIPPTK